MPTDAATSPSVSITNQQRSQARLSCAAIMYNRYRATPSDDGDTDYFQFAWGFIQRFWGPGGTYQLIANVNARGNWFMRVAKDLEAPFSMDISATTPVDPHKKSRRELLDNSCDPLMIVPNT
jgi:hypothetical protein